MKAFKVLWVDGEGMAWSMMAGRQGFFSSACPMHYPTGGAPVSAPAEGCGFLFAYDTVQHAQAGLTREFGFDTKQNFEIWSVDAEIVDLPDVDPLNPDVLKDETKFFNAWVKRTAPEGSLFCKSINLIQKVREYL